MDNKKYFGTDGIRGRVGSYPITPEFMLKLGWAIGIVFRNTSGCKVLIGKDTRISGYMFESALEAGLSATGADVMLLGPMPTPAIAYLTRTLHAQAGIVISASHNPHTDNGIKLFSKDGRKLPDTTELMIESLLDSQMNIVDSFNLGKVSRVNDAAGRYIEFCKNSVPEGIEFSGLKIVIDCANGATYKVAPFVFQELGARVITLSVEPNGLNINDNCGSIHMSQLQNTVIAENADLGIAFDGDGDRVLMVDSIGEIVDGDELLYIIARDLNRIGKTHSGVVGTIMSNLGLEVSLSKIGIPFMRTNIGDRHIILELRKHGWVIGGESSGHIVCLEHTSTGDGIITALQVLVALYLNSQSLNQLKKSFYKYPQVLLNIEYKSNVDPMSNSNIVKTYTNLSRELKGAGRIILRRSGTESLLRIMVEGNDKLLVRKCAENMAEAIRENLLSSIY